MRDLNFAFNPKPEWWEEFFYINMCETHFELRFVDTCKLVGMATSWIACEDVARRALDNLFEKEVLGED